MMVLPEYQVRALSKLEKKMYPRNTNDDFDFWLNWARLGNVKAKGHVLTMLTPLVKASIRRYFLSNMDAEDLLQEGYLVVSECIQSYDPKRGIPFLGFAKSRLKFHFMDLGRKTIKERCDSLDKTIPTSDGLLSYVDLIPDENSLVDEPLLRQEKRQALMKALAKLTPREKQVILLNLVENKNMHVVAKELGIAYRTVVNTKTNALRRLVASMQEVL